MLTTGIFVYALASGVAGYISAHLYTVFKGKKWLVVMLLTAALWPGTISLVGFAINFVSISYQSSRAVPFTTMVFSLI